MIPVLYYAHSMREYNTDKEQAELKAIQGIFWDALIFNPNRSSIQFSRDPMKACLNIVRDESVKLIVFTEHEGAIEQGVYAEIQLARKLGKPVYCYEVKNDDIFEVTGEFRRQPGKKTRYTRQ